MDDALPPLKRQRRSDADDPALALAGALGGDSVLAGARPAENPGPMKFQYRVLKALVLREMSSRHGESRLGYLMGIILPIITISVLMFAFEVRGRVFPSDFSMGVFVITGYPLWQAFSGTYNKVMGAASRSDPLLMFPQITQLDLILATVILEIATSTVTYIIMCIGALIVFPDTLPADPIGIMMCFWGCSWIGSALGLVLCGVMRLAPTIARIINSFMRLGMWMSGVVFAVNKLPPWTWPYLKWNPILHCIEGARHLWKPSYDAPLFDPVYIISAGFVLTAFGFILERATRRFVGP